MTTADDVRPLVEIHLNGLPVDLWARTQEHTDELLREFTLLAERLRQEAADATPVPVRLLELVDALTASYAGFTGEQEARLFAAADSGETSIDLTYRLPAAVADAAAHLGDLLDEADAYCRAGEHLLTLASPEDQVAFRRWFLAEFSRQVAGQPPCPWSEYGRTHPLPTAP